MLVTVTASGRAKLEGTGEDGLEELMEELSAGMVHLGLDLPRSFVVFEI